MLNRKYFVGYCAQSACSRAAECKSSREEAGGKRTEKTVNLSGSSCIPDKPSRTFRSVTESLEGTPIMTELPLAGRRACPIELRIAGADRNAWSGEATSPLPTVLFPYCLC